MRQSSVTQPDYVKKVLASEAFRLIRPVILAGLANGLLFFSVDRSQPWSVLSAVLGMALLGVVLTRQLAQIVGLEKTVEVRMRQISIVAEVVSELNSSTNVGNTLGPALENLLTALEADAGAIWLPSAVDAGRLVLVEHLGLAEAGREMELLEGVQSAFTDSADRVTRHGMVVPGQPTQRPSSCVSVKMGREGDEYGYLMVVRWHGEFSDTDLSILQAVGSDISNALRSIRMISEARRLADRDPVTGLLNHRSAYQRLYSEVDLHGKSVKPLAVLMMDLDNFKLFNDTYGHPAGDEVLKRVAGVLRRSCRQGDMVARYGGDEFMVILPETNLRQAMRCAERIQTALARERFRCEDSATLPIGFSYGISMYPDDSAEVLELVSIADANLYQSKTQGGNQITARNSSKTDSSLIYVKGFDLFRAMVSAIDNKDGYTRKHSEEVTTYSLEIAREMGLGEEMLQTIQLAGILHDVGKIGVPDNILRKPGKLMDDEYKVMQQHPVFGALIVGALPGMEQVVLGVRNHHERWDGGGYPDALAGEEIPLIGRIMAVADAFSAMTTSRPYRKGLTERQALAEIQRGLGTQFDPAIGAVFVRLREARLADAPAARRASTRRARTRAADVLVASAEALIPADEPEPAMAARPAVLPERLDSPFEPHDYPENGHVRDADSLGPTADEIMAAAERLISSAEMPA